MHTAQNPSPQVKSERPTRPRTASRRQVTRLLKTRRATRHSLGEQGAERCTRSAKTRERVQAATAVVCCMYPCPCSAVCTSACSEAVLYVGCDAACICARACRTRALSCVLRLAARAMQLRGPRDVMLPLANQPDSKSADTETAAASTRHRLRYKGPPRVAQVDVKRSSPARQIEVQQ